MPFGLKPICADVRAVFAPKSNYSLTPAVASKFHELRKPYAKFILIGSQFGGKPKIFTRPRGMSSSACVDVGRRVWRRARLEGELEALFPLFHEVVEAGVASGPLSEITLTFNPMPDDHAPVLKMVQAAFLAVFGEQFGNRCVFKITGPIYEIGKAKVHEPLADFVRGTGPYNSAARRAIEDLVEVMNKEKGTFEDVQILVSVAKADLSEHDRVPAVFYASEQPREEVEKIVEEEWGRPITHITPEQAADSDAERMVLRGFLHAARTHGKVWTMRGNIVRGVKRAFLPVLEVLLPDDERLDAGPKEWFSWDEIAARVKQSPKISKAQASSPSFLEKALAGLEAAELVRKKDDEYSLAQDFHELLHVSYYTLGDWKD